MERLQSTLRRFGIPNTEHLSYVGHVTVMAIAFQTLMIYLFVYVTRLFPSSVSTFSQDSLAYSVVLDGSSLNVEEVYFFNITNAEDFLERGAALNVTQVGPYVYRVWTERDHPVWEGETLSFSEVREYIFQADLSNGSLDDEILTWNGPLIIVAESLKKSNRSSREKFLPSLTGESVIIRKKVGELAFGHYHDDLLKKAASLANLKVPDGTFSWLKHKKKYRKFTVSTGSSDPGIVKKINGMDKLHNWNGDACNEIKGAFGKIGPPIPSEDSPYSIFIPDLCRSLTIPRGKYSKDSALLYEVDEKTFANSTENPDNYCFETRGARPSGVYSVSSCSSSRAPIWLSFPHFYLADPLYSSNINGLNASETVHDSFFKVDRNFGWGLETKLSIQMNIELSEICDIPPFHRVPKGIYPVLWSTNHVVEKDLAWVPIFISKAQGSFYSYPVKCLYAFLLIIAVMIAGQYFSILTFSKIALKKIRKAFRELKIRKAENNEGDQVDSNLKPPKNEWVLLEISNHKLIWEPNESKIIIKSIIIDQVSF